MSLMGRFAGWRVRSNSIRQRRKILRQRIYDEKAVQEGHILGRGYRKFKEGPGSSPVSSAIGFLQIIGRWLFHGFGWIIFVGIFIFIGMFGYNCYTSGYCDSLGSTVSYMTDNVPGISHLKFGLLNIFQYADPVAIDKNFGKGAWSTTTINSKDQEDLGLEFIRPPRALSSFYSPDQEISVMGELTMKSLVKDGKVRFSCVGNDKEGNIEEDQKEIDLEKGVKKQVNVLCTFPENTFTLDKRFGKVLTRIYADYDFDSTTYLEVYTLAESEILDRDNPFGDEVNPNIIDRKEGVVKSEVSRGPMELGIIARGQPFSEKGIQSFNGIRYYPLELELRESKYAPKGNKGYMRSIESILLRVPSNFDLYTEKGDFIFNGDVGDNGIIMKEYRVKQDKLDEFNDFCSESGFDYVFDLFNDECVDKIVSRYPTLFTWVKVDSLEEEGLLKTEFSAKAKYVYETYEEGLVDLERRDLAA